MSQKNETDRAPQWSDGRDAVTPSLERAALLLTEGGFDHVQVVSEAGATRNEIVAMLSGLGVAGEAMDKLVVRIPEVDPHQLSREDLLYAREIAMITLFETGNGVMDVDGRESVVEEEDDGFVVRFNRELPISAVGAPRPGSIHIHETSPRKYPDKAAAMSVLIGYYKGLGGYIVRGMDGVQGGPPAHEEGAVEDAPGAEADVAHVVEESPAVRKARDGREGGFHRAVTLDTQMSSEEATAVLAAYHGVNPERIYRFWGWLKDFAGEVVFTESSLSGRSVVFMEGRDTAGKMMNNSRLDGTTGNPQAHTG